MRGLAAHGPCPEHRMSFANVNGRGGAQAAEARAPDDGRACRRREPTCGRSRR